MGNASQSDGCVMAQMTAEMAQMNYLLHAVSIMCRSTRESDIRGIRANPTITLSDDDFCVFCLQWPKHVDRRSSAAWTALTSVYRARGTVMEKLTVRMELMKRAVVSRVNDRL